MFNATSMPSHMEECGKVEVDCIYKLAGCNSKIPRRDMTKHAQECGLLPCTAFDGTCIGSTNGCSVIITQRKDLKSHLDQCKYVQSLVVRDGDE